MQIVYWLSLAVVPGLPWWAVYAAGATPHGVTLARVLFSLSAVWASAVGMAWLCSEAGPAWLRIASGLVLGAYVFVGLPQSLHWINHRERLPAAAVAVRAARRPAAAPAVAPQQQPVATRAPTFREMFEHDFAGLPALARNVHLQSAKTGEKTAVPVRMLVELSSREKFLTVFIEHNTSSFNSCVFFLYNIDLVFQEMGLLPVESNVPSAAAVLYGKDFTFDHNIYFYTADEMTHDAQAYLDRAFREQGMFVHFRGGAYYAMHVHDPDLQQPVSADEASR